MAEPVPEPEPEPEPQPQPEPGAKKPRATLKQLVSLLRQELGLDDSLSPKQVVEEVKDFAEAAPPARVGLRGEVEWALVVLLGEDQAAEAGCALAHAT